MSSPVVILGSYHHMI